MTEGWECDNCGTFFGLAIVKTKITVSIEPRDYEMERTYCSLACFDAQREDMDRDAAEAAAYAKEHGLDHPLIASRVVRLEQTRD